MLLTWCGAYSPLVRFEQRIMVQLVGIDWADDAYIVTVQFSMGKSSDAGESANDLKTVSGKGANLYSAVKQAQTFVGKEFFFTHTQVIFLGEETLNNNPLKAIDDYLKYFDHNPTAYVAGVYGAAEELLSLTYKDEYSEKNKLLLVLENAKNTGVYPAYMIYETQIGAHSESGSFFMPMIKISESNDEEAENSQEDAEQEATVNTPQRKVSPAGGVLIIDEKIAMYMDEKQSEAIALLVKKCNFARIEFPTSDSQINSLKIFNKKVKITPKSDGENLVFNVKFSAVADKSYNHFLSKAIIDNKIDYYKIPAQKAIRQKLQYGVETTTSKGGDLIGLEDALKHRDYALWLKVGDEWCEALKQARFTYDVNLRFI